MRRETQISWVIFAVGLLIGGAATMQGAVLLGVLVLLGALFMPEISKARHGKDEPEADELELRSVDEHRKYGPRTNGKGPEA